MSICIKLLTKRPQPLPPPHNGQQSSKNHPRNSATADRGISASWSHQTPMDQHYSVVSNTGCGSSDTRALAGFDRPKRLITIVCPSLSKPRFRPRLFFWRDSHAERSIPTSFASFLRLSLSPNPSYPRAWQIGRSDCP